MNYSRTYDLLIDRFKKIPVLGYVEEHHIIPKCIGGTDDKDNLIKLSAKAHFVAHLLLAKIHGGKLLQAAWMMSQNGKYGSRKYQWLKKGFSEISSKRMMNNNYAYFRKKDFKSVNNPMYGRTGEKSPHWGKKHSEETLRKKSEALKGVPISEETKEKLRQYRIGKTASEETKNKMSEIHKKRHAERRLALAR